MTRPDADSSVGIVTLLDVRPGDVNWGLDLLMARPGSDPSLGTVVVLAARPGESS